jgi:type IV pilus assembly protein PilQ
MVISDSVGGNVTLRLQNVPWDQALDIVMRTKGLDMRREGNVMFVAPAAEIAAREKELLTARQQVQQLAPLRTEYLQINYAKAQDLATLIKSGDKSSLLSERGSVAIDERTNTLLLQDTSERLADIRRLVSTLDIPVRQVLIEARIVEASDTFSRNLGVRFGFARITNNAWLSSGATGQGASFGPATGVGGSNGSISIGSTTIASPNNVNLPASGIGGFDASSIGLTLVNDSLTALLNLEISALEQEGRGKIISSPRVITADKIKAVIEQGTEIPYQAATSSGATNVQFRKAVLKLEVTPQITPEGAIFLDVKVNKDSRGAETLSGPAIDTKNVQTQVLVDNGGTVVLGGIFEQNERTTVTKVPVLGDIPVVGYLFKNRSVVNDRTELMIFITPRVISEALATAVR